MRLAFAVVALLVFSACNDSGVNDSSRNAKSTRSPAPDSGDENSERFPIPDFLVGTEFVTDCDEAKAEVKKEDDQIHGVQRFLDDPELRPGTRQYIQKNLTKAFLNRALFIAANPSCFTVDQLKSAYKIIDTDKKST